ncbi:MAG: histidinol dehydrogenase [Armatimonadota bacterium]
MIPIYNYSALGEADRKRLMRRSQASLTDIAPTVQQWLVRIEEEGDGAVLDYIRTFDQKEGKLGWQESGSFRMEISAEDISRAYESLEPSLVEAIRKQVFLSRKFHTEYASTLLGEWETVQIEGVRAGYRRVPIARAGLYVPAGKAPLPTVAQILTVAAKAAGVGIAVVTFPPCPWESEAAIIVAANEAGADRIFRVGGIAAIGALAFGTESVPQVDKIAGPGNLYVQAAKLFVSDRVGIDMFAGPSEAMFIADETANPAFIAADVLGQCEHGPDSAGVLVTTSHHVALEIRSHIDLQLQEMDRQAYAEKALDRYSAILVFETEQELLNYVDEYAPEHLEIQTGNPSETLSKLRNVGSVFLGQFSPVAAGDYATGTNHTLPTGGAARYASAVSPETFMRTIQFQEVTRTGLKQLEPIVSEIANAEGLTAHRDSVQIRFK